MTKAWKLKPRMRGEMENQTHFKPGGNKNRRDSMNTCLGLSLPWAGGWTMTPRSRLFSDSMQRELKEELKAHWVQTQKGGAGLVMTGLSDQAGGTWCCQRSATCQKLFKTARQVYSIEAVFQQTWTWGTSLHFTCFRSLGVFCLTVCEGGYGEKIKKFKPQGMVNFGSDPSLGNSGGIKISGRVMHQVQS